MQGEGRPAPRRALDGEPAAIESVAGAGATFTVHLPLRAAAAS